MLTGYFTLIAKSRAEECIRTLDKRAQAFYSETEPLEAYLHNGLFYVRGCFELNALTLQELEEAFCQLYEAYN